MSLHICHRCPHRQKNCNGACACLIDGQDITDHAASGECPKLLFPSRGVGDTIARITTAIGITPCCGCKDRQQALNKLLPFKKE